jgi:hypothetical protein
MANGAECPIINQLQLDFAAFTWNILGSDFVRLLLTVHTQNSFFWQRSDMCQYGPTNQVRICKKVKLSHYRPGQAQRVLGGTGSQI